MCIYSIYNINKKNKLKLCSCTLIRPICVLEICAFFIDLKSKITFSAGASGIRVVNKAQKYYVTKIHIFMFDNERKINFM